MSMIVVTILFIVLLAGVALASNARLRSEDRLPMQWWITGEVTWSAPRALALAFIPALGACMFVSFILLSINLQPRRGQGDDVLAGFIGIGAVLFGIQLLHLWLIEKTLHRKGS